MNPGLVVKLRPTGPWRSGPDSGARNRVDPIYHSDSLFAAVTAAMARLGSLEEWLAATTGRAQGPAVRFSSCFPFLEDVGFVVPPRSLWPPLGGSPVAASQVRWKSARFIPLGLVGALLAGKVLEEEHWAVDGLSECLLPVGRPGPFRTALRGSAAVDRLSGAAERHTTACVEFRPGAGLWMIVSFADAAQQERWSGPVRGALRLLADSGFGGERSRGWGRSEEPEFLEGALPDMILAPIEAPPPGDPVSADAGAADGSVSSAGGVAHWLLSLFTPAAEDSVDWRRGNYATITRGGRVDSPAGAGALKKQLQMLVEGSVVFAGEEIRGAATDVAPDGFPHPVFRVGFALSVPIPTQVTP
jgi:CRISPR type III-A-associated RAMP protein Csm4